MGGVRTLPSVGLTVAINVDSADLKNVLRAIRVDSGVVLSRLNPKNVHGANCGIRSLVALSRNPKNILGPIPVDLDSAQRFRTRKMFS
jgi:hypothetical protein